MVYKAARELEALGGRERELAVVREAVQTPETLVMGLLLPIGLLQVVLAILRNLVPPGQGVQPRLSPIFPPL